MIGITRYSAVNWRTARIVLSSAVTIVLAGCTAKPAVWRPDPGAAGPLTILVDSVIVDGADAAQLGAYTSFFGRTVDGELFVADMTKRSVARFAPDGQFRGFVGRGGSGPGEFDLPSVVVVLPGDSTLGVFDVNKRALSVFSLRTQAFLRQIAFPSQDIGASWAVTEKAVFVPLHMGQQMIGRWREGDTTIVPYIPLPSDLASAPGLMIRHGRPGIARSDSGLALFLPTRAGLSIVDDSMHLRGQVTIPAARRLGEPANLGELERGDGRRGPPLRMSASSADGIQRMSDGSLLVVHLDMRIERVGDGTVRFADFQLYASIVKPDLSAACVDGVVPVKTDVPPIPVFRGDSMFVLARRVEERSVVRSVVYSVRFDTSTCHWIPTGGIRPDMH